MPELKCAAELSGSAITARSAQEHRPARARLFAESCDSRRSPGPKSKAARLPGCWSFRSSKQWRPRFAQFVSRTRALASSKKRPAGETARHYNSTVDGMSAYFVWLNRGKESAALDLKAEEDLTLLHRLVEKADILVQNLPPGAIDRLGLSKVALAEKFPRLISVHVATLVDVTEIVIYFTVATAILSLTGEFSPREEQPRRHGRRRCLDRHLSRSQPRRWPAPTAARRRIPMVGGALVALTLGNDAAHAASGLNQMKMGNA